MMGPPFLRIPPFPGHRAPPLASVGQGRKAESEAVLTALREARVGGCFWGSQPTIDGDRDIVLAPDDATQATALLSAMQGEGALHRCVMVSQSDWTHSGVPVVPRESDPWNLAVQANEVIAGAGQELALVARLLGVPLIVVGDGPFSGLDTASDAALASFVEAHVVADLSYRDPFTAELIDVVQAIAVLGAWRRLIDANRGTDAVFGVARWKRVTLDALLWPGDRPVSYAGHRRAATLNSAQRAVVWKTRTRPGTLAAVLSSGAAVGEIEDGFIRSSGLGANCVPPLSAIIDFAGIYFDPTRPSELERLLSDGEIGPEDIARAKALRTRLIEAGISKYEQGTTSVSARPDGRRRVLATGQVEDDRSMQSGGFGCTNLDLIRRARELEPAAWLIYKPHPDVEAGHRKGHVADAEALRFADAIERESPISSLIDSVDALHVITSQAGFEALLRGKEVIVHGVPFYAGWGLTRDLGPVPPRRTRTRSLDELVAATLILYPRYLDPVTRLPCPPEVLVKRLAAGQGRVSSPLVGLRELQGRLKRWGKATRVPRDA